MKNRLIAAILCIVMFLGAAVIPSAAYSYSEEKTVSVVKSAAVTKISDFLAKFRFRLTFGNDSFYQNQWQTLKTIAKVNDNVYTMNYMYDYDIDDLLERGTDSIADLLLYCSDHLADGKIDFKLNFEGTGCSAFTCKDESGNQLMGRNFDYRDAPCFVVWTAPENGYKSVSMVDANLMLYGDIIGANVWNRVRALIAPYIPMDGINEKGLSIGVLQVVTEGTNQDTGKTDITTTVAIRAVLDKAATVEEAITLLKKFDMHDPISGCNYHYMLSDATGESVVVEYFNNEMRVIENNVTTNFFQSEDAAAVKGNGQGRYKKIQETLEKSKGVLSTVDAMKLLNGVHKNYTEWKKKIIPIKVTSLWSCVYNNTESSLTLCARLDYSNLYFLKPTDPGRVYRLDGVDANITDYVPPEN